MDSISASTLKIGQTVWYAHVTPATSPCVRKCTVKSLFDPLRHITIDLATDGHGLITVKTFHIHKTPDEARQHVALLLLRKIEAAVAEAAMWHQAPTTEL